ncbi:hypothetical protein VTO42DRAFT_1189 [Malbranchea cinnamomea]
MAYSSTCPTAFRQIMSHSRVQVTKKRHFIGINPNPANLAVYQGTDVPVDPTRSWDNLCFPLVIMLNGVIVNTRFAFVDSLTATCSNWRCSVARTLAKVILRKTIQSPSLYGSSRTLLYWRATSLSTLFVACHQDALRSKLASPSVYFVHNHIPCI